MKNKIIFISALVAAFAIGYVLAPKRASHKTQPIEHQHNSAEETIYTCSMHPQIRRNEPGACPICGMDLIPLDNKNSGQDNPLVLEMTDAAVTLANISTTLVGVGDVAGKSGIRLTGKMQADESTTASIVSHIPGRIEQLYVRFTGEHIKKGQRIATIYSPDLIAAQRELLEAEKIKEVTPALLTAAKNKLKYLKISDRQIEQILSSGQVQENFDIYSEYSGVVTKRNVAVSDYLKTGSILFEIQDLSKLWAVFDVYENQLAKLRKGSVVEFTANAIPNKTFRAVIDFIDPLIRPDTRTASVRASIRNGRSELKPEMFITGEVKTRKPTGASKLMVPKTAVLWTGKRSVVYVKLPEVKVPSFEFREVELGEMVGDKYLIVSGLSAGEEVVTKGAFVIDASAQLNNQASMMNRLVSLNSEASAAPVIPDYKKSSSEFRRQLGHLAQAYLRLKVAFVRTDSEEASHSAQAFLKELKNVQMELLKGDAHVYWMKKMKALKSHAQAIVETEDVDGQREQFQYLSNEMIETMKAFGSLDKLYVQHCPMAFDGQGADWISSESVIKNPYYGDKMLRCGSVTDSL